MFWIVLDWSGIACSMLALLVVPCSHNDDGLAVGQHFQTCHQTKENKRKKLGEKKHKKSGSVKKRHGLRKKTLGHVDQEFPLQNGILNIQGFQSRLGFLHTTSSTKWTLYFWGCSLFQVASMLRCMSMPGSPLCRGHGFLESQMCTRNGGVGRPHFVEKKKWLHFWIVPHFVQAWGP